MSFETIPAGFASQAPVTIYDKTKPYLAGRVFQKTIDGTLVLGPPLTGYLNTIGDVGILPQASHTTPNGRHFVLTSITAGIATVGLYQFDFTGQTIPSYAGKIQIRVPNAAATTHTVKGFRVYDGANPAAVTGWQIFIGTTATIVFNGGLFIANNISQSDFVPISPPTIEMAVASNAKAVYMAQDPGSIGVNNTLTAMQGLSMDPANRRLYFNNNVLATTQFAVFDPSATPNIVLQTTTSPTVNASPTFTLTGHGYAANDPVVITANAPTNFTASNATSAQTVYFVRNPTTNTFELSATTGGASINAGSVTASTVVTRAFGQSVSQWLNIRTGTITGITGTIVLTNSQKTVIPTQSTDPLIPASVNNQTCIFLPTSTTFHLFKVSDITNGATSFPSMVAVNNQGNGTDYTGITTSNATYSATTGRIVYTSNVSQFYVKRWINNVIDMPFGGINTTYLETPSLTPYTFAGVTVNNLEVEQGWLLLCLSTVGQRGTLYMDFRSDASNGYSFTTSPVVNTSDVQAAGLLGTIEKLFDLTAPMAFSYKTAATSSDAIFNDPTTGWSVLPIAANLSGSAFNNFSQFRIDFSIADGSVNTPAQVYDLYLSYTSKIANSANWSIVNDGTTQGAASPSDTIFRLQTAYVSSVPTLYAHDNDRDTLASVAVFNTAANPTNFNYSTDGGTTWIPLGTIPNVVGTLVRYRRTLPGGTNAFVSIKEV